MPVGEAGILAALAAAGDRPGPRILLIDGRSGSGKTTLARRLVDAWPGAALIRLEDIYPGWDGLDAASDHLVERVLVPLAAGRSARWRRWDWVEDRPAEWNDVPQASALVIEGCGALTARSRALASLGVWVELDAATRKQRALARDGETYAPHWDRWAAQEEAYAAREHPRDHADIAVDGRDVASSMAG